MRKALLVDDSAWIHALVRANLGRDFEVASAFDGTSGLVKASECAPELILLDVDLPDLHGYEVCRRLKQSTATRSIPIIFLSAMANIEQRVGGLDCGACDYLVKPVDPRELRAKIQAVVRERQTVDSCTQDALIDLSTGLFSRRYLEFRLEGELARARRSGHSLACLMLGLNGNFAGNSSLDLGTDNALCDIARAAQEVCRRGDVICRYSQGSIAILAISMDKAAMESLAQRVQDAVYSYGDRSPHLPQRLSVNIGVALSRFSTGMGLIHEASEALAKAATLSHRHIVVGNELLELQLAG